MKSIVPNLAYLVSIRWIILALSSVLLFAQAACTRVLSSGGDLISSIVGDNSNLAVRVTTKVVTVGTLQPPRVLVTGGVPPYRYEVVSGSGAVDANTGVFTPLPPVGLTTIKVTDAVGTQRTVQLRSEMVRTNGDVIVLAEDQSHLYVGGQFTRVNPVYAPAVMVIDVGRSEVGFECDLGMGFDGQVTAIAMTADSYFIAGDFQTYKVSEAAPQLVKIRRSDCAIDPVFNSTATMFQQLPVGGSAARINKLLIHGDSIYVGGYFNSYRGVPGSALNITKLNLMTGELDLVFSPPQSNGLDGEVVALATDGTSLFVGGAFASYRGEIGSANGIAKLNLSSGEIDTTFSPPTENGFDSPVLGLALFGTSLYAVGNFTQYRDVPNSASTIAKLDSRTGDLDTVFNPLNAGGLERSGQPQASVTDVTVAGNSLFVSGNFTHYRGQALAVRNLIRLNLQNGQSVGSFNVPSNHQLFTFGQIDVMERNENWLFVAGSAGIGKINVSTGVFDADFSIGECRCGVSELAISGDVLLAGVSGSGATFGGTIANNLAKFRKATGAAESTFNSSTSSGFTSTSAIGLVRSLALQGTSLYVAGSFDGYRGVSGSANGIAKIDTVTGVLDTTFSPPANNGFDGQIQEIALSGSSLFVGGYFFNYRGQSCGNLAKLDATTGNLDTAFNAPTGTFNTPVFSVVSDGSSVYVGGGFTSYRTVGSSNRIAKLDLVTGDLDLAFNPPGNNGFDAPVWKLVLHGSSLYASGYFTAYRGVAGSANRIAKLDKTTGALDTDFSPPASNGFSDFVGGLAVQGSNLYVNGNVVAYRGVDLKDASTGHYPRFVRINLSNGTLDPTFRPTWAQSVSGAFAGLQMMSDGLWVFGQNVNFARDGDRSRVSRGLTLIDTTTGTSKD